MRVFAGQSLKVVDCIAQPRLELFRQRFCFTEDRSSKTCNGLADIVTGRSKLRFRARGGLSCAGVFALCFKQAPVGLGLRLERLNPLSNHARALSPGEEDIDHKQGQHSHACQQADRIAEPLDREVRHFPAKIGWLHQDRGE